MSTAERERRHQSNLERINAVQMVVGRGDRMHIDHEGTLLERSRMFAEELCAHQATELGLAAFDRLLRLTEESDARRVRDVTAFIAAIWNQQPLPLIALRGLDQCVGDDMLAVLDAFRYARLNLAEQVEGGPRRVAKAVNKGAKVRA